MFELPSPPQETEKKQKTTFSPLKKIILVRGGDVNSISGVGLEQVDLGLFELKEV